MTPAKACWQNIDLLLLTLLPVSSGNAFLQVTIPNNPILKGLQVFSQFVIDDPGVSGLTTTAGGVIRPQ